MQQEIENVRIIIERDLSIINTHSTMLNNQFHIIQQASGCNIKWNYQPAVFLNN